MTSTRQGRSLARLIAYYLPQYHPIPENDIWWGKGFTEWTNVARARPLFPGHRQPRLPGELGFYDLRVPETRAAQADLARSHGVEGFMYWHYWFAGKRLLERPFNEVLRSGEPDFPFCLGWANLSWTGVWFGAPERTLVEQTYPGPADHEAHFGAVLDAFADDRYITVGGKPLFVVQHPRRIPEPKAFTDQWRDLARRAGLPGIHFVGIFPVDQSPGEFGFDASVVEPLGWFLRESRKTPTLIATIRRRLAGFRLTRRPSAILRGPKVHPYADFVNALPRLSSIFLLYPCVLPGWDNTPRSGARGIVLQHSNPELFGFHLQQAIAQVAHRQWEERLVFLHSWNEWAEGAYLEPDQEFGRSYLEVVRQETLRRQVH
jgi:lipopolysaccharide biosynthesis protein